MRYSIIILSLLTLLWTPVVSIAKEFTCTIQCKDQSGNLKEVTVLVDAPDKVKAEGRLVGFINLNLSKAAGICKNNGYKGLFIQKGKKTVNCR